VHAELHAGADQGPDDVPQAPAVSGQGQEAPVTDLEVLKAALERVIHLDGVLRWTVDEPEEGDESGVVRDHLGSRVCTPQDVPSAGDARENGEAIALCVTAMPELLAELQALSAGPPAGVRRGLPSSESIVAWLRYMGTAHRDLEAKRELDRVLGLANNTLGALRKAIESGDLRIGGD
jgi:hypothetical protein